MYKNDEHDFQTYKRRGIICFHCGKIFTTIEKATGDEYHKRPKDPDQIEMLITSITTSRAISTDKKKRVKEITHELRELSDTP